MAVDMAAEAPANKSNNGTHYLLSDEQTLLGPKGKTVFNHQAARAIDQRGVESVAHISFDFDPSYQTPQLHFLRVYRGKSVQDRSAKAAVKFLQRERDLESRIYDGSETVDITLDDIRPGDIVEYAYNLHGSNPVLGKYEYGYFNLQWASPVAEVHRRVVAAAGEQLQWRGLSGAQEPNVTRSGAQVEYSWHLHNVPGAAFPDDTPKWWSPFARVEWATYIDWPAVARWGEELYAVRTVADPGLKGEVDRIAAETSDPERRIGAVLDFVQSHVRYLGIEIGPGSFAPRSPDLVYQRRFGDCKDKTMLAVAMLRQLGVEAYPALVNTRLGRRVAEHLPSPGAFDHVVLVARVGESQWWLDATRLPQKAAIREIGQANYGQALVLDGGSKGLTVIPVARPSVNKKHVAIRVDASKGFASSPTVEVVTRFDGVSAERMRETLRTRDLDELQHDYENWYARDYRGLKRAGRMTVLDDVALNRVTTDEHYELQTLVRQDTNNRDVVWLFARDMKGLLALPSDSARSAPLAVRGPEEIKVVLTALLPDDRPIKADSATVKDTAFEFTRHISQTGREMRLEYGYHTLADQVDPGELAQHITNLESARGKVGYTLRPRPPAPSVDALRDSLIDAFGPVVAFMVMLTLGSNLELATSMLASIPLAVVACVLFGVCLFASRVVKTDGALFGCRRGAMLAAAGLALTVVVSLVAGSAYRATNAAGQSTFALPDSGSSQLARTAAEKAHREAIASVKFDGLDQPLRGISTPLPELPAAALLPENTGVVQLEFFIESDGSVRDVMPMGAPHRLLAQISKETVERWKFAPPISKGKPVRQMVFQEFSFVLE